MTPDNPWALHGAADHAGAQRWIVSAIVIVAAHLGLIVAGLAWVQQSPPAGVEMPAIMVDMAPASAAPEPQVEDIAPGPEMQQADETPPEPVEPERQVAEQVESSPPQEKPEAELPPEQKEPEPPKPEPVVAEPAKPEPKPEPPKEKPKPVQKKPPSERPPAPRTTAPQRAERQAALASAARSGAAAAAALPSYRDRLAAHLQRYKQYPTASKSAGEQGVAMLSFTVGRGGQLLAARLARSSGSAALDAETLAMVRRAQPLPAFPPEMTQSSLSFTVPVRFALR